MPPVWTSAHTTQFTSVGAELRLWLKLLEQLLAGQRNEKTMGKLRFGGPKGQKYSSKMLLGRVRH